MAQNRNTSISLGPHFTDFIAGQVGSGHYSSASEVVRAGLRLLEEQQERRAALRKAIQEGIDSGVAEDFDQDEFLIRMRARHGAKA